MLETYSADASASLVISSMSNGATMRTLAINVATTMRPKPGTNRRIRLAQNVPKATDPLSTESVRSRRVIRYPDTTKNTSTPMNPPEKPGRPA